MAVQLGQSSAAQTTPSLQLATLVNTSSVFPTPQPNGTGTGDIHFLYFMHVIAFLLIRTRCFQEDMEVDTHTAQILRAVRLQLHPAK